MDHLWLCFVFSFKSRCVLLGLGKRFEVYIIWSPNHFQQARSSQTNKITSQRIPLILILISTIPFLLSFYDKLPEKVRGGLTFRAAHSMRSWPKWDHGQMEAIGFSTVIDTSAYIIVWHSHYSINTTIHHAPLFNSFTYFHAICISPPSIHFSAFLRFWPSQTIVYYWFVSTTFLFLL